MSDRKKVAIAIVGSLILHVLIILLVGETSARWPQVDISSSSEPKPESTPTELTLLDQPPPSTPDRQYVRTNDDQKVEQAPKDAPFESDKDTAAASEKEGKGKDPVPTQEGKDLPELAMRNENYSLDTQGREFSSQPPHSPQALAAPAPTPQPTATPVSTPEPTTTPQSDAAPAPAPTPQLTATPAPTADSEELALVRPSPTPEPTSAPVVTPEPTATPAPTPRPEELALLRPSPTPVLTPVPEAQQQRQRPAQGSPKTAFRPQQIVRRMEGNVSTRGRSSVAAIGTPQGRFQKAVEDAVGSRWYYYVQQRSDLINIGTVRISFAVTPDGRVQHPQVVSNTSNQTLANSSLQSILDAKIPPMPPELAPLVPGSGLEFTFSFNFM